MIATSAPSTVRADRVAMLAGLLGSRITAALAVVLGSLEITETRGVLVLCRLARLGPLRPREIQAMTGLTSGGTTNLLDRLARLELIERSHDLVEGDRRAVVVQLAPRGQEVVVTVATVFSKHAGAILSTLRALDDELAGIADGSDPDAGTPSAPRSADRAVGDARPDPAGRIDRLLDAVATFAGLGITLRTALVAGIEQEEVFGNETAVILGSLLRGGPRRPRDLAALVPLSSGGLAKLLARLEVAGLVTQDRHRLEADRRATIVSISPAGRRAMAAADATLAERRDEIRPIVRELASLLGG
ncbi:MAG: MarR family transcriptional regulator [Chloroflexota bacterium]|nr:MarR family transcriptional regulator [Chloroflexota bacterium]